MKSKISIVLVLVTVLLSFAACSNIPDEPAVTETDNFSYVDPYAEVVSPPVNLPENGTYTVQYVEELKNIEIINKSYFADGNTAAKIVDLEFLALDEISPDRGLATIEIIGKALGQEYMRIAYKAYDKDGKILRNTYLQGKLEGVGKGETCEPAPFEIPTGTVKIEFFDYVED